MEEMTTYELYNTLPDFKYEVLVNDKEDEGREGSTDFTYSETPVDIPNEDILEGEFDSTVSKADKRDYLMATACGVFSGALSILWSKKFDLTEAHNWGNEKADKIVKDVAKLSGYKGNDLEGALQFLEKKYPMSGDSLTAAFGGGKQHHLRDFSHHPTIFGLICSIIMQFTGEGLGTDTQGRIIHVKITKEGVIGSTLPEKVMCGTINWFMHLISDFDGSSSSVLNGTGKGTGIPGPILAMLKELSALPIFSKIDNDSINKPKVFSEYISKLFNGTLLKDENGDGIRFDMRTEMGIGHFIMDQAKPVIINECLVRTCFMVTRFIDEVHAKGIKSISELSKLDAKHFIPFNSRAMTRMVTVSSGTFVAVNMSGVAVKSVIKSKGNGAGFAKEFFLSINYVGIGRFVIACASDSEYIIEDVKEAYTKYINEKEALKRSQFSFGYQFMSLKEEENRVLYSLKALAIEYDIEKTKDQKQQFIKKEWLRQWKEATLKSFNIEDDNYFLDADHTYAELYRIDTEKEHKGWLYLLTMEMALFEAYYTIEEEQKELFKGLKYSNKYLFDVFASSQKFLSKEDIESVIRSYKNYVLKLKDTGKKTAITLGATAVATLASGGLALAFAPEIAVLLAGEAVTGLSGAALTSASLATIGGGSLAAGGLGMAGGTAILTSGGALLGFASSGAASLATVISQTSEQYTLNECAKLLTFCKLVLVDKYNNLALLNPVAAALEKCIDGVEDELEKYDSKNKKDKVAIRRINSSIKYLSNAIREIDKMLMPEFNLIEAAKQRLTGKAGDIAAIEAKTD